VCGLKPEVERGEAREGAQEKPEWSVR
jgi:hypothetical protein